MEGTGGRGEAIDSSMHGREPRMVLRLYVCGSAPNSMAARANLRRILSSQKQAYSVQVIDCLDDPLSALKEGVLVTPTLIRSEPGPLVTIIGSLSDLARVRDALGIRPPRTSGGTATHGEPAKEAATPA